MNPFTQMLENGKEHLHQLRLEAHVTALQPKNPSLTKVLRRRLAKLLKNWAQLLDEPQTAHA
jgi:ribosomal protein L29